MELRRFGPADSDPRLAGTANRVPGLRPISLIGPWRDTPMTDRDEEAPQVSCGDVTLREARAELTEVRKRWHTLQVEIESLHAVERSLQSSLRHTQRQYSLQLRDLSQTASDLETELDEVREGLATQKQHHSQLLNTKMRLKSEIGTYRRLLEQEEGRFLSGESRVQKLKSAQQNGVCNGFEMDVDQIAFTVKSSDQHPSLHHPVVHTECRNGEISTVKSKEIMKGSVVQESAEGQGRVEPETIDKAIKQWEGSFFQGNPKLRKKSVSLRFDLHMAVADEGHARCEPYSLPDVEVRLVMKRSRSISSITP